MSGETQERQTFYYSYSFDGREGEGQIDLGIPPPFATTDVEVVLQRFGLERALREVANIEGIVVTNFEDELCYVPDGFDDMPGDVYVIGNAVFKFGRIRPPTLELEGYSFCKIQKTEHQASIIQFPQREG